MARIPIFPTGSPPPKDKNRKTTPPGGKDDPDKKKKKKSDKDKVSAAEKRAIKRENEAKRKAGKKYLEQAENLSAQAKAIRQALHSEFGSARDNNLADISRTLTQQLAMLQEGQGLRAAQFLQVGQDAEIATGATAESAYGNAIRERQDTMSGILEQGAGETDTMRAMLMAARNWQANAGETNRSYFDSMRSVNQSIVDLNIDTKAALANAHSSAEGEKDRIWQDFYNRRSEAFTNLGNTLGQQADYYASAKEMGVKPKKGAEAAAEKAMKKAFMDAALESGKGYTQQGLPTWITDYQGTQALQAKQSNTDLAAAMTMEKMAKAEGATLRKWDAA